MSEESENICYIKELNPAIIQPATAKCTDGSWGGSKILIVGKPGTGKSSLLASLLYAKKHIFPVAVAFSGSEDTNHFYKKILPSTFVFNEYSEDQLKSVIRRQKIAKGYLSNPWAIVILDDCTDDTRVFNTTLQQSIWKKGRHCAMLYIV